MLELGSGTGLAGLGFAAFGAHVLLTDLSKCMVWHWLVCRPAGFRCSAVVYPLQEMLRRNAANNHSLVCVAGGSVQCCPYVWGTTPVTDLPQLWQRPQLVIAADVVYHTELVQPLLAAVRATGGPGSQPAQPGTPPALGT